MIALGAIVGLFLQSCDNDEPEVAVYTAPSFKATNNSASGEKALTASDNKVVVNLTYTVTMIVNGESQVFTGSCCSNELPVMVSNEIAITASFDENAATSNICFTMPDGCKETVTKTSPTYKWTVPTSFSDGDKIIAQWADNSGKMIYE